MTIKARATVTNRYDSLLNGKPHTEVRLEVGASGPDTLMGTLTFTPAPAQVANLPVGTMFELELRIVP